MTLSTIWKRCLMMFGRSESGCKLTSEKRSSPSSGRASNAESTRSKPESADYLKHATVIEMVQDGKKITFKLPSEAERLVERLNREPNTSARIRNDTARSGSPVNVVMAGLLALLLPLTIGLIGQLVCSPGFIADRHEPTVAKVATPGVIQVSENTEIRTASDGVQEWYVNGRKLPMNPLFPSSEKMIWVDLPSRNSCKYRMGQRYRIATSRCTLHHISTIVT